MCQFPLDRDRRLRLVESISGGGVRARRFDKGRKVTWQLRYDNLSDAETLQLEQFYLARGGGLESFTFVDPMANVLMDSELPAGAAWQGSGAGVAQMGVEWEGFQVLGMSPGTALEQSIEAGGGLQYCASVWVRGTEGDRFGVDLAGNPAEFAVGPSWRRCWSVMAPAGSDGVVPVRFECLGPGSVEIAGLSVEAQAHPGETRASGAGRSLYRNARFGEGGFQAIPTGPNRNQVWVRVEAAIEDEP